MKFVVSRKGACSFCPRNDSESSAYAGVTGRKERVCGMCLGLYLTILRRHDEGENEKQLVEQLARVERRFGIVNRAMQTVLSGGGFDKVAVFRELIGADKNPEEIGAYLEAGRSGRSCSVGTGGRDPVAKRTCSFCDSPRDNVLYLYIRREGAICVRCIDDATAAVVATTVTT
jgi:hypothetical protein